MTPRHRTSNEKFEIVMIVFGAFVFVLGDILFLLIDDDDGQLEKKLVSVRSRMQSNELDSRIENCENKQTMPRSFVVHTTHTFKHTHTAGGCKTVVLPYRSSEPQHTPYLRTKILGVGEGSNIIEHYPLLYALRRSKVFYKFETE